MNVDSFRKLLDRVTRRTSRRVEMAAQVMKAVEATAKWVPEPPPKKKRTGLTVYFKDGENLNWHTDGEGTTAGVWNDFLKWYHGRSSSPSFVMQYKDGRTMFRRRDIKRYIINDWESSS